MFVSLMKRALVISSKKKVLGRQAQRLAIHFEDSITFLVFDPEIVSDGDQVLTDFITGCHEPFLEK
jgi:hypothetical protein